MRIVSEKVVKGKRRVVMDLDEIPIQLINQLRDEVEQLKKQLSSQPQQSE